jgi:Leucine-rich repeat (LRR) protein
VPEGVYLTRELRVLSLADNALAEFPADLCRRLGHVTSLDLSRNQLRALPPQFRRLDSLLVLSLAHNPLQDWTLYSVFALPHVWAL